MTIKKVLDMFSMQNLTVYENSKSSERLISVKSTGDCPLQWVTGMNEGYTARARELGLEQRDCERIMGWADCGRWYISPDFYVLTQNPMD